MTTFVPRLLSDRLTLGWISVFIACAAGCQSELADPQSGSSSTAPEQSMGGGKSSSNSAGLGGDNEQGGADGATKSSSQGGDHATSSDSGTPSGGAGDKPDSGGSSAVSSERGGASSAQGGTSSAATTRGDAAKAGASSAAQGGTATGGRSSRNSATGGRTQLGSATGGRAFGGQATGGKSQASATGGKAQGGTAATGGSTTTNASTAPSSDAQAYVDATNAVRAAVTAPPNYTGTWVPLPNVTWSEEVAASAQKWANHLRDAENCGLVHEQNTGLGENLAMGTRLAPAEAVNMWASEKSKFTYSSPFQYTAAAGHYSQLVWRTSIEIGCASATCGNSVVISCRYKPPGNVIGGKIY